MCRGSILPSLIPRLNWFHCFCLLGFRRERRFFSPYFHPSCTARSSANWTNFNKPVIDNGPIRCEVWYVCAKRKRIYLCERSRWAKLCSRKRGGRSLWIERKKLLQKLGEGYTYIHTHFSTRRSLWSHSLYFFFALSFCPAIFLIQAPLQSSQN